MIRIVFCALSAIALAGGPALADPVGVWTTPKGAVRIADCDEALCGTIVSLKKPTTDKGEPMLDIRNPDEGKRNRQIVGLSVLNGMKPSGDQWLGQVYNPEDGRTYKAYLSEEGGDKLKVQGCALGGLFCKTQVWRKSD